MESKTENEEKVIVDAVTESTESKSTESANGEVVDVKSVEDESSDTKRLSTKEIIAYLAEKFPACFSIQGNAKVLKIGIFQDLAEKLADDEKVSKTRLRQALRHYTSSWRYLKAVKVGNFRVDIEGNNSAEVDQTQADYASRTLKESQEKFGNKNTKDQSAKKPNKSSTNKSAKPVNKSNNKSATDNSRKEKFNAVKSSKRSAPIAAVKLKPVESSSAVVGKLVKVQLGQSSMDAMITEVSGKDVSVQLNSGMVIKTQVKNIFTE